MVLRRLEVKQPVGLHSLADEKSQPIGDNLVPDAPANCAHVGTPQYNCARKIAATQHVYAKFGAPTRLQYAEFGAPTRLRYTNLEHPTTIAVNSGILAMSVRLLEYKEVQIR